MVGQLVVACEGGVEFALVSKLVRRHRLFGTWVAFKVGDMLERVLQCPVNFDAAAVFMFKDPMRAAEMLYRERMGINDPSVKIKVDAIVGPIVDHLKHEFRDLTAPPYHDRGIDLQEIETCLCCFKSHLNGHYPLNNDIDEINAGLPGWGETARAFGAAMPKPMELEECLVK